MAKSGFWLRGSKGKLAGTVLYQSQGSTIQREIVTPKNPQSDNQMRQRAAFAGASKFYQNAQQNRFVLAFQNKKGNQSEFNAFMQKNLREFDTLTYPTREQANTPEFCNFFPWICTEGNLQGIPAAFADDGLLGLGADVVVRSNSAWASDWDELIALNPTLDLKYGDIITVTIVLNDEIFSDTALDVVVGNVSPRWITRQVIVGADLDGNPLEDYFYLNGFQFFTSKDNKEVMYVDLDNVCAELKINEEEEYQYNDNKVAAMVCVTRSHREGSQLKVSSSRFYLNDMAQRIFERLSNDTQMREAIESYKNSANSNITPSNILQGSVAEDFADITSFRYYDGSAYKTVKASKLLATNIYPDPSVPGVKSAPLYIRTKKHIDRSEYSGTAQSGTVVFAPTRDEETEQRVQLNYDTSATGNKIYEIKLQDIIIASGNVVLGS